MIGGVLYYHRPCFSATGKHLYVPCDSSVKVYAVKTGLLLHSIDTSAGVVTSVNTSEDGTLLVGSLGGQVMAYNMDSKKELWTFKVQVPVHQVIVIDSNTLILVSQLVSDNPSAPADTAFCRAFPKESHSFLYRFDVNTGNCEMICKRPGRAMVEYRDGLLFVADRQSASVNTISGTELTIIYQFRLKRAAMCMQLSFESDPAQAFMAIGDGTGRITLWYYNHTTKHSLLHWHSDAVRSIACLPSGYLLSAGAESVLVMWRVADQFKRFLPKIGDILEHIVVDKSFSRFAVSTRANKIHFVDAASFRVPDHQPAIVGVSGFGVGCQAFGVPLFTVSDGTIVMKGANGTIQAFDTQRDRQVGELQVVEQLLTDPSHTNTARNPHVPDVETFHVSADCQWMATVEGRPASRPHFGYLKMWKRRSGYDFKYDCHTIIHRPHTGPVESVEVGQVGGEWVCVSASSSDSFKIWKLEQVYDEAKLETKYSWRPFYTDPLKQGPTAICLNSDGSLAVAYHNSIVVMDLKPLLNGTAVHPQFMKRLQMVGMKRLINKLHYTHSTLIAATNNDLLRITLDNAIKWWSVQCRAVSVHGDRLCCLAVSAEETSWLLEYSVSDPEFLVRGRRQLEGVGRAVLCTAESTVCIYGDGLVSVLGSSNAIDGTNTDDQQMAKRARIVTDALSSSVPPRTIMKPKRAAPVKSRSHLFPLVSTTNLPSMRTILHSFLLPRIPI